MGWYSRLLPALGRYTLRFSWAASLLGLKVLRELAGGRKVRPDISHEDPD